MSHYAIVVDLDRCIGCHGCEIACKNENEVELGSFWNKVVQVGPFGDYPHLHQYFLPVMCQQCDDSPCTHVCPTGASYRDENNVVLVDKEKCIGCKSCMEACPYGARYLVQSEDGYFGSELNEYESVAYENMPKMTVDKCDFCIEHSGDGKPDPVCVKACMAEARLFGDLDEMKKLVAERGGEAYLPEEGTEPRVFYLPTITA